MTEVGVHEAKTRFSQLLRDVERGEDVVVTRDGRPVARIVSVVPPEPKPIARFGLLKDEFGDTGEWDNADSDEMADLFGIPRLDAPA